MTEMPTAPADVVYRSLTELQRLIQRREIGSVELLELFGRRIAGKNPALNAVVVSDMDRAMDAARRADQASSDVRKRPLHGIPMTVKESFDVAGLATTRGVPEMAGRIAGGNASTVQRLLDAGAIVMGKTNVPYALADYQSFNDIYGVTNNPWNLDRTPGGSSGGSAAALAAGMTPVELGGDLGGSIRIPAAFCGVFGHKPTYGIIPFGRNTPDNPEPALDVAVPGPLTRSAEDLSELFEILAGPDLFQARGWRLDLPRPRFDRIDQLRIAVWIDDPRFPVDAAVKEQLEKFVSQLGKLCPNVREARPTIDVTAHLRLFVRLIRSATSRHVSDTAAVQLANELAASPVDDWQDDEKRAVLLPHRHWLAAAAERERYRHLWQSFFADYDVLLAPVMPVTALPHQHDPDFRKRRLTIDGIDHPYIERLFWSSLAGVSYLPSTVIPGGLSRDGMPVGMQLIGPAFGDRATIGAAGMIAKELGGFLRPPNY